ncbi:MAG: FtsH protease activity modulator HflK [Myxococcota bacterium]
MKLVRRYAVVLVLMAAVGGYLSMGVYEVKPDEQAVVLRLGAYDRTSESGLQWYAPWLERVEIQRVTVTREEEFGYRTITPGPPAQYEDQPEEKRMITGDENLVSLEFVVQYRIASLRDYLFNVAPPVEDLVRDVSQAAIRAVVGQRRTDEVLTEARGPIEVSTHQRIQDVLDGYGAGIRIQSVQLQDVQPPESVKEAFAEVTSAEQDRERMVLEARGYADKVVPEARGAAAELLNQARGYKESHVLRAQGEADRFLALLTEYRKAPEVTRSRLYIETLEEILPRMEKVIMEQGNTDRILPYLPLGRRDGAR